jgi:anti-sigma factor RsiW
MGRLHDARLQRHLDGCPKCTAGVVEHRAWIAALNDGLSSLLNLIGVLALKENGPRQRRRYLLLIEL